MKTPTYDYKDKYQFFEPAFLFIFLLTSIVSYLRGIGYIVTEREGRNIDNLENMGISKFTYYSASFFALFVL
jgi:hypothetical protein